MDAWNPWHGCHKVSPGCKYCYVYRRDESVGRDASKVYRTKSFDLPIQKKKDGSYRFWHQGEVFTCGTSDFFLEEADAWRLDAWRYIRDRADLNFLIITKRIHRFYHALPEDWGAGYENVRIGCTVENQQMADKRLPIFLGLPILHRAVICEPLLEGIDLSEYLSVEKIDMVVAGGESGPKARDCRFEWIQSLHRQCVQRDVSFYFKQTGTHFIKDGRRYWIKKRDQHSQAQKAGLYYQGRGRQG